MLLTKHLVAQQTAITQNLAYNTHNFDLKCMYEKGLDTCYSAAYMSQTRDKQRFAISEVAADWHEPMVPQRIMRLSTARANRQLDPRCS